MPTLIGPICPEAGDGLRLSFQRVGDYAYDTSNVGGGTAFQLQKVDVHTNAVVEVSPVLPTSPYCSWVIDPTTSILYIDAGDGFYSYNISDWSLIAHSTVIGKVGQTINGTGSALRVVHSGGNTYLVTAAHSSSAGTQGYLLVNAATLAEIARYDWHTDRYEDNTIKWQDFSGIAVTASGDIWTLEHKRSKYWYESYSQRYVDAYQLRHMVASPTGFATNETFDITEQSVDYSVGSYYTADRALGWWWGGNSPLLICADDVSDSLLLWGYGLNWVSNSDYGEFFARFDTSTHTINQIYRFPSGSMASNFCNGMSLDGCHNSMFGWCRVGATGTISLQTFRVSDFSLVDSIPMESLFSSAGIHDEEPWMWMRDIQQRWWFGSAIGTVPNSQLFKLEPRLTHLKMTWTEPDPDLVSGYKVRFRATESEIYLSPPVWSPPLGGGAWSTPVELAANIRSYIFYDTAASFAYQAELQPLYLDGRTPVWLDAGTYTVGGES